MKKEYYVGDIIKSKNTKTIDLVEKYDADVLKFAYDLKMALEMNDIKDLDTRSMNQIINIALACFDVVEYLDINGTRRAYDYWLLTNHEEYDEMYNIFDHILYFYKLDKDSIKKMYASNGFVIIEALLSTNIDEFNETLKKKEVKEHKSFIEIDERNRKLN